MLSIALALSLLLSAQPTKPPSDEAEIRKAFAQYRDALLKKDGGAAAEVVDTETLAYYTRMRDLALKGDAATVKKQSFIDRMMVVRLRHEVGADALKKMGGRELFAYAVTQGWVSARSVEKAQLGKVKIAGKEATGEYIVGGQVAPFTFVFKQGEQGWRFSLLPLLVIGESAMKQMAKQAGQEENQFLFALVEEVSGKAVPEDIWEPLVASSKPSPPTRR